MARNLANIESVSKAFDIKPLLVDVTLGISEGERIGIVGRNGGGKSTLLKIIAGLESADSGRVTRSGSARIGMLQQVDSAPLGSTVRDLVLGDTKKHEWASDSGVREIFTGLFGGFTDSLLDRTFDSLSGGERRRVGIAQLLINPLDLLLLDEPTNHLDLEGVTWLASHLRARRDLAVLVITHDRWFLDEVSEYIWEVVDGKVEEYEGGYSAYVLSKVERVRQISVENSRRNNLIRKELAWLRRGAPARTTKPKFRVDTANQLIAGEPPPRNKSELLNFAANRLGNTVFEIHKGQLSIDESVLVDSMDWNVGPGDRIGLVGVNGSGKTTLMKVLAGEHRLKRGKLIKGITVKTAFLSQHLEELDPTWRVLEAVESVAHRAELGGGREISASQLCERLGFDYAGQQTMVRDLSGGEKRRLQLTRLLMDSPNVLLLDEPTNDFDVEALTALEDLLDSFAGTMIVISHDRYFLERTCDQFIGMLNNKTIRGLPRGIDEYLELRSALLSKPISSAVKSPLSSSAQARIIEKQIVRLEKQIARKLSEESDIEAELETAAFDHEKLIEITLKLDMVREQRSKLEEEWLRASTDNGQR